jgi:DNA replication protein
MESSGRFHIPALFCQDFFATGFTLLPNLLLRYNARLSLEKMGLLVLLALFYFQQTGKNDPELKDFAQLLNVPEKEVQDAINVLQNRGLLDINDNCLEPNGLFTKLADLWAEEKVQALQQEQHEVPEVNVVKAAGQPAATYLAKLINTFETEFGRPLTPMECSQINRWYKVLGYSEEQIRDALKRAVLRGICNLNYIDKILNQWQKNNLRTTWDVYQYEERFQEQRQRRKSKERPGAQSADKEEKYKDLYLT